MSLSLPHSTALKLWVVLNRALRTIEARLERQVEAHGLTFTEFAVLEVLLHKGPLPIGELGGRVLLASGSMTYVVDKLCRRSLIERRPCEADRRVIHAHLTSDGESLISGVFAEYAALIDEVMGTLTPQEQETATELLKRLGLAVSARPISETGASAT